MPCEDADVHRETVIVKIGVMLPQVKELPGAGREFTEDASMVL
jgi:hypothetical protein